jgi:hypothetical protein
MNERAEKPAIRGGPKEGGQPKGNQANGHSVPAGKIHILLLLYGVLRLPHDRRDAGERASRLDECLIAESAILFIVVAVPVDVTE